MEVACTRGPMKATSTSDPEVTASQNNVWKGVRSLEERLINLSGVWESLTKVGDSVPALRENTVSRESFLELSCRISLLEGGGPDAKDYFDERTGCTDCSDYDVSGPGYDYKLQSGECAE